MYSSAGPCPHRSIPVEMDESMTSSNLDLAWPPCHQCPDGQVDSREKPRVNGINHTGVPIHTVGQAGYSKQQWRTMESPNLHHSQRQPEHRNSVYPGPRPPFSPQNHPELMNSRHAANLRRDRGAYEGPLVVDPARANVFTGFPSWPMENSLEEVEQLEPPLPLLSDLSRMHFVQPSRHAAPGFDAVPSSRYTRTWQQPMNHHHNYNLDNFYDHNYPVERQQELHQCPPSRSTATQHQLFRNDVPSGRPKNVPPAAAPPREVMEEVGVGFSYPVALGQTGGASKATKEIRRTITLPEECRKVFITYSVDTAKDMLPFTKFLTDHGFNPSIDIFDNPLRNLDITKWMDSFLNNKSVLIIVAISPKYKEDVDGDGEDEHGLHTKYIHNQIQNEFIAQRCLNFRLVPVLFPTATKRHVPSWLQSTRIYRWPDDTQDLMLRLLREERYIAPRMVKDITLTVRPA